MPRSAGPLLAVSLAVIPLLIAPAAEAAIVQQVQFQQYSFQDNLSLETTLPSEIGACVVEFAADADEGYLNVAAFIPGLSTAPQWVVHNLRLHPLGEAEPVETITCQFPLSALGIEAGMMAGPVEYGLEVMPAPMLDADAPAWLATVPVNLPAAFAQQIVQVGEGGPAVEEEFNTAEPDVWFSVSETAGADTVKANIGCKMPNIDLVGGNDVNACAPASAANSLNWLKGEYPTQIDFPQDLRGTMDQISRLAGRVGPTGVWPKDLARAKLDFIDAHNLPIHVKIQDRSSDGDVASTSGRLSATDKDGGAGTWPTRKFIFEEARKGEDVEVFVSWYYWDAASGKWLPSNYSHALVLTGAGTKAGADWVKLKDDLHQGTPGGLREPESGVTDMGWGLELPGLRITIPDGPGKGLQGRPFVSGVISESKDESVTPPPATERVSSYCQYIKRTVPAGATISFTFPDTGATRCYNATMTLREPGPYGHDIRFGPWNLNRGKTVTWTNNGLKPEVVMLHNDDYAGGQTPYPAFDVGVTITPASGGKRADTPFNPDAYGGFSLGGRDSSSAGYAGFDLGPSVAVGPILDGLDLVAVPSRLAVASPGTRDLLLTADVPAWNLYWEELGLVIDVLDVATPGDLLVECPGTGFVDVIPIAAPGRYERTLGHLAPTTTFELHLIAQNGLDLTLDALGVPSLVPVDLTGVPRAEARVSLSAAAPNPFNPRTVLRFDLPRETRVRLAVYDVRGRLVAVLEDGVLPAGPHEAVWDGRTAEGRAAPSGTYLCRLTADGQVRTTQAVMVR